MEQPSQSEWPEDEYLECLKHERHMFAWTLKTFGLIAQEEAGALTARFYPYEPPSLPLRGIVFHDEAWHWAMLQINGELYWKARPGLETPPPEYRREADRFKNEKI